MIRKTGSSTRANGRRGATLPEVLISLVVLAVGLTAVIALFPVGINRVRNAVLDTRTTQMARNAIETFHLKRMYNDEFLINWRAHDTQLVQELLTGQAANPTSSQTLDTYILPGSVPTPINQYSYPPFGSAGNWTAATPTDQYWGYYLNASQNQAPEDPNSTADDGDGANMNNVSPSFNRSYPILLDPWLFDHMWVTLGLQTAGGAAGIPRLNIATPLANITGYGGYYSDPVNAPFCDIAVTTSSEIAYLPLGSIDRDMVKTRWFASLSDIEFVDATPGQPRNPRAQDFLNNPTPMTPVNYLELQTEPPGLPLTTGQPTRPTALRTYDFTWAAMIQRNLIEDPETGTNNNPSVARPSSGNRAFLGKVSILCFYRRNVTQPYSIVEGCFYNGSRKVTLSWPIGTATPTIKAGVWLCEASVSRDTSGSTFNGTCNRNSAVYPNHPAWDSGDPICKFHYRRAFKFYKVLEASPPEIAANPDNNELRTYQEVVVDRPAAGYPVSYSRLDVANGNVPLYGTDATPDQRPRDFFVAPSWPIVDEPNIGRFSAFDDETNVTQGNRLKLNNYSPYYPVIIFDGLREVFEYEY